MGAFCSTDTADRSDEANYDFYYSGDNDDESWSESARSGLAILPAEAAEDAARDGPADYSFAAGANAIRFTLRSLKVHKHAGDMEGIKADLAKLANLYRSKEDESKAQKCRLKLYSLLPGREYPDTCSICLERLEGLTTSDGAAVRLQVREPCYHLYHERCLAGWRQIERSDQAAPLQCPDCMRQLQEHQGW